MQLRASNLAALHGQGLPPEGNVLMALDAAAHCAFRLETYEAWVRRGLLPGPTNGGWSPAALTEALDRLSRDGFQPHTLIPNIQRQSRTDTVGIKRIHHYRRGMSGALPGHPGSAAFMRALIAKERELAAMQGASTDNEQPETTAQLHLKSPPTAPKLVTRASAPATAQRKLSRPAPNIVVRPAPDVAGGQLSPARLKNTEPKTAEEFLTEADIVTRYRGAIVPGTLKNWRHQNTGPPWIRVGRTALYPREALLAWERQQTVNCDPDDPDNASPSSRPKEGVPT